ncbi:MAG: 4-(cytidine 5'-diphospho)-2-C-methyl-D-erythritol kinase [Desulfamplus sp.]|nr:4-(cytidine 5'-diphospho)-2-C-methyl-D-erythritol kinase [Desulfamplus sp.]
MVIKSPAKINLFLYVTGRRDNGYHDLFTLMSCVDLYDEIELTFNQPNTYVVCNSPDIPKDEANIAFKAVTLFNKYFISKCSISDNCFNSSFVKGVKIDIKKNIPVGAGLGGGSSNAASVLKAINQFYGNPFSLNELMEMGLKLGADVPFFILGRTAIAEGVGEELTPLPLSTPLFELEQLEASKAKDKIEKSRTKDKKNIYILLFYPGLSASTAQVYKNLDLALTKSVKSNNKCLLKSSDIIQRLNIIKGLVHNDLELTTCDLYPEIGLFKKELLYYLDYDKELSEGLLLPQKIMMTGSGSTFFSLFYDYEKAQLCFNELSEKWKFTKRQVFITSFVNF